MLRPLTEQEEWDDLKNSLTSLMLLDNLDNPIWLKQIKEKIEQEPKLLEETYYYRGESRYSLLDISVAIGNPHLVSLFLPFFPNWSNVICNEFYHCLTNLNHKNNFPIIQDMIESHYGIKLIEELPNHILPTFMQNCFLVENKYFFNLAFEHFSQTANVENLPDLPIMLTNTIEKDSLKSVLYEDYFNILWKSYDIDYVNMAGKTILNLAIEKHNFYLANYLLEQQASIDYVNSDNLNSFELYFKHILEEKIHYSLEASSRQLFRSFIHIIQDDYKNLKQPKRFHAIFDMIKDYENQPQKSLIQSFYHELNHHHFFEEFEIIRMKAIMKPEREVKDKAKVKI